MDYWDIKVTLITRFVEKGTQIILTILLVLLVFLVVNIRIRIRIKFVYTNEIRDANLF